MSSAALQMQTSSLRWQQTYPVLGSLHALHVLCVSFCLLCKYAVPGNSQDLGTAVITFSAVGHVTAAKVQGNAWWRR